MDLSAFQPPTPLEDEQVVKMRRLQEGTLHLANLLADILPNVDDRDKAIEALKEVKLFGESAIKWGRTILTPAVLAQHFAPTEARDLRVVRVWMNVFNFADVRKWGRDILNVESQAINLRKGIMGVAFNATLCVTKQIKPGYIVVISDHEAEETKSYDLEPGWIPAPNQLIRL